jgi:biopolymer transport protein ExbB/TolQ
MLLNIASVVLAAADTAKKAADEPSGWLAPVYILMEHGKPFAYINCISLLVAIVLIIERSIALNRYNINAEEFMKTLVKFVREGQIDKARKLCQAAPQAVLARVMQSALESSNRGEAEISAAMEESTLELTPLISKRIPALFPLANIATLIGLIGTISGLIKTFRSLSGAGVTPEMKAQMLSSGISEAMYNTAFGLIIAVSCIAAQLFLATKAKGMVEDIEFNTVRMENLLGRRIAGEIDAVA